MGAALLLACATLSFGCEDKSPNRLHGAAGKAQRPVVAPPPRADVLQLLSPWKVGTEVEGFRIVAIHGVFEGSIWVLLKNKDAVAYLEITRAGEGPAPPHASPPFSVYVASRGGVGDFVLVSLAESAGAVMRANRWAPIPEDLETFHRGGRLPDPP